MTVRTVPYSEQAEASLLGACMFSAHALEILIRDVNVEDFYKPSHQMIAQCLRELWHAGIAVPDPTVVGDELKSKGQLEDVGGVGALVGMQAITSVGLAAKYATIVVEYSMKRQVIALAAEAMNDAYGEANVHDTIAGFRDRMADMRLPIVDAAPSMTILDVLETDADYDWLVPGLIERKDRLILTGGEGGGKSTLLRQLAVTLAAGVHPFNGLNLDDAVKVYYLDVENGFLQFKRKATRLVDRVHQRLIPENLRVDVRTGGLELTRRHDSSWLLGRLAANRPDVFISGPIYKLHAEDPNKEEPARQLAALFDEIRERFGCAVILEAHSPHQTMGSKRPLRPVGASLWMRWPEFGFGLRKAGETTVYFEDWRGPRDERAWPLGLRRGMADEWPWMENQMLPTEPGDGVGDPQYVGPAEEPF